MTVNYSVVEQRARASERASVRVQKRGRERERPMPPVTDRCLPIYVFRHRLFHNDDRVLDAGTSTFRQSLSNGRFILPDDARTL